MSLKNITKDLGVKNCLYCDTELVFNIRRSGREHCNDSCKRKHENGIGDIVNCLECGTEFVKTRKDKRFCKGSCATRYRSDAGPRQRKYSNRFRDPKLGQSTMEFRKEVREFFKKCKAKKWKLGETDLFQILDYYAQRFPGPGNRSSADENEYIRMVIKLKTDLNL
jgi:hypothetical protein